MKYPVPVQIEITRIELVRWIDACGPDCVTTLTPYDVKEMTPLATSDIGFLVKEDKECIVLAPELNDDGGIRRPICIPKSCILSRTQLVGRKRRKERR